MDELAAYLPQERVRALARGRALPETSHGAALFADLSGFTPLTEPGSPAMLSLPRPTRRRLTRPAPSGNLISRWRRKPAWPVSRSGAAPWPRR